MEQFVPDDPRVARLSKFFNDVLYGRRILNSSRDGKLFIEAICCQSDPATCAHRLISSPSASGLTALQASVRFDTTVKFLNGEAVQLLQYLMTPSLAAISSGTVLCQILTSIVEPPFFFDSVLSNFRSSLLSPDASRTYAWLLLQLITLPEKPTSRHLLLAKDPEIQSLILKSPDGETRILGQKIKHNLALDSVVLADEESGPGGRHDNDFADYKQISIMPTQTELLSKERPFLRQANYFDEALSTSPSQATVASDRLAVHKDNQFRLLREDMLGEIREELQKLTGAKTGRHKGVIIGDLTVIGIELGEEKKRLPWGIKLQCKGTLPHLTNIKPHKYKTHLQNNPQILRHQNMACLMVDNEVVAFPTIHRDLDGLAKIPSVIVVQLPDDPTMHESLSKMKTGQNIKLIQLDTAVFAYEPFLARLQAIRDLSLAEDILHWNQGKILRGPTFQPSRVIESLQGRVMNDIQSLLRTKSSVRLDESQLRSLLASLSQRVSLVQGPPGTGKSFIGALIAKILHDHTKQVILVICYTNHALDQFLEDLLDIGIPSSSMVRLGGKSTTRTKPLTLSEQNRTAKLTQSHWNQINELKLGLERHDKRLRDAFLRLRATNIQKQQLMEYLEFCTEDLPFFETFTVVNDGNMTQVGRRGKAVGPYYLLDRWIRGSPDAGVLQRYRLGDPAVWEMTPEMRQAALSRWQNAILDDLVAEICRVGKEFNADQAEIDRVFGQRDASVIKSKRIIACTTTGAAKFSASIQATSPGIVLVEEAGEILESHIFTALGPETEQLILIGDHQQLRPKCSFELGVEKGDGYDLNRSLFERLILKGYPHVTLTKQHRMRPEISSIIRHLTYPHLVDADSTLNRGNLRGFRDNVIFVNHTTPEIELQTRELRDGTTSKQNLFEAEMILKCVRYLAQQGYGPDKLVVLTPYLGQLKLLRDQLARENDPILNDLDRFDLVRAGLLTDLSPKEFKPSLRISTVDNYQGEESDIVLVSLTRSNASHDIGFMSSPERLNVLLSRARDAMIMIGNSDTFMHARKGRDLWRKFFGFLLQNGHVYEGVPVRCEKHRDREALLSKPSDFELYCPDGGCKEPCAVLLKCGVHKCTSSCHQLSDHSKMKCMAVLKQQCPKGHNQSWICDDPVPATCRKCEKEIKDAEKKDLKALKDQQRRDEQTANHQKEVAKLQESIDQITQGMQDARLAADQEAVLRQMRTDLDSAKERARKAASIPDETYPTNTGQDGKQFHKVTSDQAVPPSSAPSSKSKSLNIIQHHIRDCVDHNSSAAKTEWQRQKDQENASNPAIDKIMEMIGLESVKSQVLSIKSKVDTSKRQGIDLKKDRFGLVLLGNPGTGKTTVARHYANVLTSLDVLPGDGFIETTGSRLATGGVAEVKTHITTLENSEGGVYFIDEAYQLAQGHNYGGKAVLDYLLAEIENLTGKIVFVFAGYRKQMELFFEHNPGFSSRIPYTLNFEDYTDAELLQMLQYQITKHYGGSMSVEDGAYGLYTRIAVRRLGRGRGREGFGNARALENIFSRIRERQSDRLTKERRAGLSPDDNLITKEDLIGPDPSKAILQSKAWEKLQQLTGLQAVKKSVSVLVDLIKVNYERELQEKPPIELPLNRVFLGSPGTGKTTVAKLYGQILADVGLLSNGEVVTKNPADFIGNAMGQSETNTKNILATTIGKVLIIDEAYMLSSGSSGSGSTNGADAYKTAVIDTIVAEVQSVPGEDRCVLLLGYEDQMVEMFQNCNPGLTRRFQLKDAFHFEDFNNTQLEEILRLKLKQQDLGATDDSIKVAIDVLSRLRNGLNFGNGGDVENIISKAKGNFQSRQATLPTEKRSFDFIFEPQDFDPDFDRASRAEMNLHDLFQDVIGCEAIVDKLEGYLRVAKKMRAHGMDPRGQIPMNFIFKGPPGTGKTTTARKFGEVFSSLGFLTEVKVEEISATDLIGQYVGQTGPKTIKQLERGLGKVLFVDEAYRLGEGMFAQEAVNELVDTMTKPRFAGKLVIILAGYDNDMNNLLKVNEGLSSRFADEINFPALSPQHCLSLLETRLKQSDIEFPGIHSPITHQQLLLKIRELTKLPSWGNARDVQTLAQSMTRSVFSSQSDSLTLSDTEAFKSLHSMLFDRQKRNSSTPKNQSIMPGQACQTFDPLQAMLTNKESTFTSTQTASEPPGDTQPEEQTSDHEEDIRDSGVSDAIWAQLQIDKKREEQEVNLAEQRLRESEEALRKSEEVEREMAAKAKARNDESLRTRIRERIAKAEREKLQREYERRRKEEMERKRAEEKVQKKLREMGVCCMGYQWIKQSGGYRCAGGSHYVSDGQLGI